MNTERWADLARSRYDRPRKQCIRMNLSGIQKQRVENWTVKYLSNISDNLVKQLHPFQQNALCIPKSLNLGNDVCSGIDN